MKGMTAEMRFNSKFIIDKESNCWVWQAGKRDQRGYGEFYYKGKNILSHRFSYEMYNGVIPKNLTVDHLCKNPSCVNPLHLETVNRHENARRGDNEIANNAEKTHCKFGHPYDVINTYFKENGQRNCRMCGNQRQKDYQIRKKRGVDVLR